MNALTKDDCPYTVCVVRHTDDCPIFGNYLCWRFSEDTEETEESMNAATNESLLDSGAVNHSLPPAACIPEPGAQPPGGAGGGGEARSPSRPALGDTLSRAATIAEQRWLSLRGDAPEGHYVGDTGARGSADRGTSGEGTGVPGYGAD